jgi:hypothetical protein
MKKKMKLDGVNPLTFGDFGDDWPVEVLGHFGVVRRIYKGPDGEDKSGWFLTTDMTNSDTPVAFLACLKPNAWDQSFTDGPDGWSDSRYILTDGKGTYYACYFCRNVHDSTDLFSLRESSEDTYPSPSSDNGVVFDERVKAWIRKAIKKYSNTVDFGE